jgi:hypothetical protein
MDLQRKIEMAKRAIESIARHHDEPADQVDAAMREVVGHAADEMNALPDRRKAHEEAIAKEVSEAKARAAAHAAATPSGEGEAQTLTAQDVGTISAADLERNA